MYKRTNKSNFHSIVLYYPHLHVSVAVFDDPHGAELNVKSTINFVCSKFVHLLKL
jgi:hypothetical protein